MIFWRGWGIIVPLIILGCMIGLQVALNTISGNPQFYSSHNWAKALGVALSAPLLWLFGNRLHNRPGRIVIDKITQKEIELKPRHDFMFIKVEYWSAIVIVLSLLGLFAS